VSEKETDVEPSCYFWKEVQLHLFLVEQLQLHMMLMFVQLALSNNIHTK